MSKQIAIKVSNTVNTAKIQHNLPKRLVGKPFQKGVSGNPCGKPKGSKNFKTVFFNALKQVKKEDGNSYTEIDLIKIGIERLFSEMEKGNHKYHRLYIDTLNRIYGMPRQSVDHTSGGEKINVPIITGMRIIYENK